MRAFTITVVLGLLLSGTAFAQLPAQKGVPGKGQRPTAAPQGKTIVAEPTKVPATNLRSTKRAPKAAVVIPSIAYKIGIRGYPATDGVVVMSTMKDRDLDQGGKIRCPAREIDVDFRGNGKLVKVALEAGDKITEIDSFETRTIEELVVAINSADDPHAIAITFIDWRTGNEYVGTINAMRVK